MFARSLMMPQEPKHLGIWPFSVTFKVGPGAHGLAALGYIVAPCLARLALVLRLGGNPTCASSFQGNPVPFGCNIDAGVRQ